MKKIILFLALALCFLLPIEARAAYTVSATIANGAALSSAIDMTQWIAQGSPTPIAIIMPAAWTTAGITLQASNDGVNYNEVYTQAGSEYTVTTPAASEYIILNPPDLEGMTYIKIRSGTAGSPVNQGAARTISLVLYKGVQ